VLQCDLAPTFQLQVQVLALASPQQLLAAGLAAATRFDLAPTFPD
jgi:hypothetical protein